MDIVQTEVIPIDGKLSNFSHKGRLRKVFRFLKALSLSQVILFVQNSWIVQKEQKDQMRGQ